MGEMRKKLIKKLGYFAATFAMAIGVFGSINLAYAAEGAQAGGNGQNEGGLSQLSDEPTEITEISLDVELLKANSYYDGSITNVTCSSDEYTLRVYEWNDLGGYDLADYGAGEKYYVIPNEMCRIVIGLFAKDGYVIPEGTPVLINGSSDNVYVQYVNLKDLSIDYLSKPEITGTVSGIDIADVKMPVVGEKATSITWDDPNNYSVTGSWSVYDEDSDEYTPVDENYVFVEGKIYKLTYEFKTDEGYVFDDDLTLNSDVEEQSFEYDDCSAKVEYTKSFFKEIVELRLNEDVFPKAVLGEKFNGEEISFKLPEGCNCKATGVWRDKEGNTSGTFEKGKDYDFDITFYADKGYSFAQDAIVIVGDESTGLNVNLKEAYYYTSQSFKEKLSKVYLTDIPDAVPGEEIQRGTDGGMNFDIKVPKDANYTAKGYWMELEAYDIHGTFQSGKVYFLYIDITAGEGCRFNEDALINVDGIDYKPVGHGDSYLVYGETFVLCKEIDEIVVDGIETPVIGGTPSVDSIKVPEGANYILTSAKWLEHVTDEEAKTFKDGRDYYLHLVFEAKDGYAFSDYYSLIIDGKNQGGLGQASYKELRVGCEYTSFKPIVEEIKLNNVPEVKLGEMPDTLVTIPKDANYKIYDANWYVWDDENACFGPFSGPFKAGNIYQFAVYVEPKEGYQFSKKDTVVYINGAVDESVAVYENGFGYVVEYTEGMKVIDVLEFTVQEPNTGNHASISPSVKAAGDISVNDKNWCLVKDKYRHTYNGHFEEDGEYGVFMSISAPEGYIFSDDMIVIVNGIALSARDIDKLSSKEAYISYDFNAECAHIYDVYKDAGDGNHTMTCTVCGHKETEKHIYNEASDKCNKCNAKKEDKTNGKAPNEGDGVSIAYIIGLMAMCAVAVYGLDKKIIDCKK